MRYVNTTKLSRASIGKNYLLCGILTLVIVIAALGLTFVIHLVVPDAVFPYLSFYPAVFIAAWLCGNRSGTVTLFAGVLSGAYFYKQYILLETLWKAGFVIPTVVFLFTNLTIIWMSHKYQNALMDQVKARDDIEKALVARDEFLSMASHELKTPLTTIKLQVQMALKALSQKGKTPSVEELNLIFENCETQILRITSLVNDLLDVSLAQTNRLRYDFETRDLTKTLEEVCEMYHFVATEAGSGITCNIEKNLTSVIDPFRIEQVLVNLFTNAIKYGGGKPFEVKAYSENNFAVIEVRDFGIGIEKEKQRKIFERYERAVSNKNFNGLGLGLYITRSIVLSHKGTISFQSEIGKGSTFTVRLPIQVNKEINRPDTLGGGSESHRLST